MNKAKFYKLSEYIKQIQFIYNNNKYDFNFDKQKMTNFIYQWKKTSNKFNKYSIFENPYIYNNKYILREYKYFLFNTSKKKKKS
jgi:hypothetical protein